MYIGVKYVDKDLTKLNKTDTGDCIDLRVSDVKLDRGSYKGLWFYSNNDDKHNQNFYYKKGDTVFINYGVVLKVPDDKRVNVYPRSSTFKKYGLILTNSVAIIDNSYQGNEDVICGMFYALKDGCLNYNDRIAQFEVVDRMICHNDDIVELKEMNDSNRGGYGSTGVK